MTFGDKLRESRKAAGLSQEELAEKLNVSRQAITKWETGAGIPDIGNLMTISNLFGIALDDFISEEKLAKPAKVRLYESTTEYDLDGAKDFDIKLGGANSITIYGCGSKTSNENEDGAEKIKVVLSSDSYATLQQDFKTKIDDLKYCIDIDVNRAKNVTETAARELLHIEVFLPNKYLSHTEIDANCKSLSILNLECKSIEFDGRASNVTIDGLKGVLEMNCDLDMKVDLKSFEGTVELNQVRASSRITVAKNQDFRTVVKGLGDSAIYEENGSTVEDFSSADSKNLIKLNGMKSELIIERK